MAKSSGRQVPKRLFELFPISRYNYKRETSNLGRFASIGRGFIYEMTVQTARSTGINEQTYVGLTRRSVDIRTKEHIRDATKLGPLGSAAGGIKHTLSFGSKATPLQVLIRTAIGTVETQEERARNYLRIERVAEPSVFALQAYEINRIGGKVSDYSGKRRYDTTLDMMSLNQSEGGEGVSWKLLTPAERAVGAFLYLRDEVGVGPVSSYIDATYDKNKGKYSKQEIFLTILLSFYNARDYLGNYRSLRLKARNEMIRHLTDYYTFGQLAELMIFRDNKIIRSGTERNITYNHLSRLTTKLKHREDLVRSFRNLVDLEKERLKLTDAGIYEFFLSGKSRDFPIRESSVTREIQEFIHDFAAEAHEFIVEDFRKKLKKKEK